MNVIELERSLRQLRLSGIAATLETRLRQAQAEPMAPIDLVASLVTDELNLRSERLIERRRKQAAFRDQHNTLARIQPEYCPVHAASPAMPLLRHRCVSRFSPALSGERISKTLC